MSTFTEKWSTLSQVKSVLIKKWCNGLFLRDFIESEDLFPYKIPLRGPNPNDLSSKFELARDWVQQFITTDKTQLFRVEWQVINNRVLGQNQIPAALVFDSRENLLKYINKGSDFKLFSESCGEVLAVFPELMEWILKHPFTLIEHASSITLLIRVAAWMKASPRPGVYLRQLSLPDIDTKFIETHKKLLTEWFDTILDPSVVDFSATGVKGFEHRYGFLERPLQIRFRILDKSLYLQGLSDLTLIADEFSTLQLAIDTVFVTENDINGLAFPMVDKSIIIFGRGYGFEYLQSANWLRNKQILYWGDIDTHGFAILSQFRKQFQSTKSFLMDRETLMTFKQFWVREATPSAATLNNLTEEEAALYEDLRSNTLGESVRLEQEFIPFDYVMLGLLKQDNLNKKF